MQGVAKPLEDTFVGLEPGVRLVDQSYGGSFFGGIIVICPEDDQFVRNESEKNPPRLSAEQLVEPLQTLVAQLLAAREPEHLLVDGL